jgi:hypothetical protein
MKAIEEEQVTFQLKSPFTSCSISLFYPLNTKKATMNVIQDKEFMQHFWDLAVDDADVRRAAAAKVTANDIPSNYKSYTLKRLVKGLTSPRDSARLGFATALTQFLVNHQVDPQEVLTLLDEHTKVCLACT